MNDSQEIVVQEKEAGLVPAPMTADVGSLLGAIMKAAGDPAVDVLKLEKLIEIYSSLADRQAAQAYNVAMTQCQAEIEPVARDSHNTQTNSRYAKLETVISAIKPIYTKYGFGLSFGTDISPMEGHDRITCKVTHTSGYHENVFADVPRDLAGIRGTQNKTNTHAWGSTQTYGRRYLTLGIFNVSTVDGAMLRDDDGQAAMDAHREGMLDNIPKDAPPPRRRLSEAELRRIRLELLPGTEKTEHDVVRWVNAQDQHQSPEHPEPVGTLEEILAERWFKRIESLLLARKAEVKKQKDREAQRRDERFPEEVPF